MSTTTLPGTSHTSLIPGLALTTAAVLAAIALSRLGVSALLIAIVLGVVAGNLTSLPPSLTPGLAFASRRLLRLGIVMLGLQLTLGDVWALGPGLIAVVVAVVTVGIGSTIMLGRALGIGRDQRLLIACGFSICGAAAVAAADGVIDADEEDVVTAIALVVAFGTAMIAVVPAVAAMLGLSPETAGVFAGASVHEVAQVVAVGGSLGAAALNGAVVVKLARVLLLAPVMAVISLRQRRLGSTTSVRPPVIPLFVAGFLAMVTLRSAGVVPPVVVGPASVVQTALLASAMFALGTGARISAFRKLGPRHLVLAALSTTVVASVALAGTMLTS